MTKQEIILFWIIFPVIIFACAGIFGDWGFWLTFGPFAFAYSWYLFYYQPKKEKKFEVIERIYGYGPCERCGSDRWSTKTKLNGKRYFVMCRNCSHIRKLHD
jgi:hypothetical protein